MYPFSASFTCNSSDELILCKLCRGMNHLHQLKPHSIIHRDLTPRYCNLNFVLKVYFEGIKMVGLVRNPTIFQYNARERMSHSPFISLTEMSYKMKQDTLRSQSPVYAKLLRKKMHLHTKWLGEQVHVRSFIFLKVKHFFEFEKILRQFYDIFRSLHGTWGLSPRIIWEEYWCLLLCCNSTWGKTKWKK